MTTKLNRRLLSLQKAPIPKPAPQPKRPQSDSSPRHTAAAQPTNTVKPGTASGSDALAAQGVRAGVGAGAQALKAVDAHRGISDFSGLKAHANAPTQAVKSQGADPFALKENLDKLDPGDKWTMSSGLTTKGGVVDVGGANSISIQASKERTESGKPKSFTVSETNELGVAGKLSPGASTPVGTVGAEASLSTGGSQKTEYRADTKEDAEKLAQILRKPEKLEGVANQDPASFRSDADKKFLEARKSAEEFSLNGSASGSAEAGLGVSASVGTEKSARVEYENGKPSTLVLKEKAVVDAQAGWDPSAKSEAQGHSAHIPVFGGTGAIEAKQETRIPLKDGFDPAKFLAHPQSMAQKLDAANATTTLTATGKLNGSALGNGSEGRVSVSVKGKPSELGDTFRKLASGDPQGLEALNNNAEAELKISKIDRSGLTVNPGAKVAGVGANTLFSSIRERNEDLFSVKGKPSEVAQKTAEAIASNVANTVQQGVDAVSSKVVEGAEAVDEGIKETQRRFAEAIDALTQTPTLQPVDFARPMTEAIENVAAVVS